MATEAPTTPYPGDPARVLARCPTHDRPLHWDGEAWRCYRKSTAGHVVERDAVVWGKRRTAGKQPGWSDLGDPVWIRFGDVEQALRDRAEATGQTFTETVREACRAGLKSLSRSESRSRSR